MKDKTPMYNIGETAPSRVETIAKGLGVKLVLLHAASCLPAQDAAGQSHPEEIDKEYLEGLAEQLKNRGVEAQVEVLCHHVPNEIIEHCEKDKEALLVMFTHGGDISIIL
jgi:nucleotide-binding universal stress UspA family protein